MNLILITLLLLIIGCATTQTKQKHLVWDMGGEKGGVYAVYQDGLIAGNTSQLSWPIQKNHIYCVKSLETGLTSTNFEYK